MTLTDLNIIWTKVKNLLYQKSTALMDQVLYQLGSGHKGINKNEVFTVYFIGENLPPRIPRMVKWLKRSRNMKAVLICHINGYNAIYSNDSFDNVVLFRNVWHLRRILRAMARPDLMHGFGPKSYYPDMARQYLPEVKFVYDMQDVLAIYFGLGVDIRWYQQEFPHERNCLALSDGLVSHGLEPIPAKRIYGIKDQKPRLFFPLFCDDDVFRSSDKKMDLEHISIVYAGEIQGAARDKKQFGHVQFFDLIDMLSAQKIHFHIYPAPQSYKLFGHEYRAVEKVNPYFHLHEPVQQSKLSEDLSKYHFGIIPFFKSNTAQSDDKNHYSTSLKLFNFIEAGIPIFVSSEIGFQNWIAKRYGAGISITKDDLKRLRTMVEQMDYDVLVRGLMEGRQKLSLKNNIGKLNTYYNDITGFNQK